MKRFVILVSAVIVLSIAIDACTMGQTPPPATQAPATEPPATEPPAADAPTGEPALVTVDLAGPAMEVGSKYVYVDGAVLVAVPGGPFIMGYSYADNPKREVSVSDFWIYNSEVTNQQYSLCVNTGKCSAPDKKDNPSFGNYRFINFPVVGVTHKQAEEYCTFVHGRLPTEAEWEKAARGPEGNIFPWGDGAPKCDLLNFNFCKGKAIDIQTYPEGVSYYGLFDMAGNIREWAADWYKNDYFKDYSGEDPLGPELGDKRAIRSSSFADSGDFAISAHRYSLNPSAHLPDLGFRCVVEDPTYFAPMCEQKAFYGSGPLGSGNECVPNPDCNSVGINVSLPDCVVPPNVYTIITFTLGATPPDAWSYDEDGCDPTGNPDQFICQQSEGDGPVSVTGSCEIDPSCTLGCSPPEYYDLVGGECKWNGSGVIGTECIAGTTYDPLLHCCSAVPGSGVDFNICPDGSSPIDGSCSDAVFTIDSESYDVQYTGNVCGSPGDDTSGDDDGQCPPPQTWTCTRDPRCGQFPTGGCPYPDICSCR